MPFLDAVAPIALAHRGYAPDGCENSMRAFERALELGYRYLETDVRATSDGVALAFHDARLDRVTDMRGRISELPWSRVRRARIGGREPIPRLDELLAAWPDARVNIDVKAAQAITPTVDAIQRTGAIDRVCVGAFSGQRVTQLRAALGPRLCTALAPGEVFALRNLAAGRRVPSSGRTPITDPDGAPRCVQVPARVGRLTFTDVRLVATAHELGLPVHVWTVNDRSQMESVLALGVDGVITDAADVLRDVLIARGQWPQRASADRPATGQRG